ncbi:unnamed protein product [Dovyalis caffra]|uniref:Uncharacterized protein n=1 Tax=Dovyalis caffra TaxID=77055 RepID=A0AAV1SUP5_9ROSI|nr:unnamed protein product [Dovyalis caffra]
MAGWWWVTQKIGNGVCSKIKHDELLLVGTSRRLMTAKAPNRAAVHGTKLPVTETIDREEAEKEINKWKEEKEKKRKEVEKIVDSQLNSPDKPYSAIK